jgi:ABC-type phosphate/phosphonate transport system substrate-binding protein
VKRKRIILLLAVFGVLEAFAIVYAVWPMLTYKKVVRSKEIRLGIVPDISKARSEKEWETFLEVFKDEKNFKIRPYFANSYDEAIKGFIAGSLDMLYINPAVFLTMKGQYNAKPLVYRRYPKKEKDKNRSALIAKEGSRYIEDTKGLRISFTDTFSLTGYIMAEHYLKEKLQVNKMSEWFSEISFSGSEYLSFEKLMDNNTDLIAVNLMNLADYSKVSGEGENVTLIPVWISMALPEPMICLSSASKYYKNEEFLENFKNTLWMDSKKGLSEL